MPSVLNYSGTTQELDGRIFPPGGPYAVDEGFLLNNGHEGYDTLMFEVGGTSSHNFEPDYGAAYSTGVTHGIPFMGAVLLVMLLKRAAGGGIDI